MAGKTKRSGEWGKEEHIRVQLNIERQQFSQPTKEMANARPRGLRIWYRIQITKCTQAVQGGFWEFIRALQSNINTNILPS